MGETRVVWLSPPPPTQDAETTSGREKKWVLLDAGDASNNSWLLRLNPLIDASDTSYVRLRGDGWHSEI